MKILSVFRKNSRKKLRRNTVLRNRLRHEVLEGRQLLAVDLVSGVFHDVNGSGELNIVGTGADETIVVGATSFTVNGGDPVAYVAVPTSSIRVDGGAGNDNISISGLDLPATLLGRDGTDTLDASSLTAVAALDGGDDNDILIGGAGNDSLNGGVGGDTMSGNDGDDFFFFSEDGDTADGGNGNDRIDAGGATEGITETLNTVEFFAGSNFADVVDGGGTAAALTFVGRGGNDNFTGGTGNDTFQGGAGDDTFVGGAGNDVFFGDAGADSYDGSAGDDDFFVDGSDLGPAVVGGSGYDEIRAVAGATLNLTLGAGTDIEQVVGGAGDDVVDASAATTNLQLIGGGGNDTLTGGSGNDGISGGDGNDTLTGGPGNDGIVPGSGSDIIDLTGNAAGQRDILSYRDATSGVDINLIDGTNNQGETFTFDANSNLILYLSDHNDTVTASARVDRPFGFGGTDTISYAVSPAGISVRLDGAKGTGGHAADDRLNGIENVIGSAFGDTIVGNDEANELSGGDGNDTISGAGGDDLINGGDGIDNLTGDDDDDVINGGEGNDIITGQDGNDTLNGDEGNDRLEGNAGVDVFDAGAGDDQVFADDTDNLLGSTGGTNVLSGVFQGDQIFFSTAVAGINLNVSTLGFEVINGSSFDDVFTNEDSATNIVIFGNNGNDQLTGGTGADLLFGGNGDDIVRGSLVADGQNDRVDGDGDSDTGFVEAGVDTALDLEIINPL